MERYSVVYESLAEQDVNEIADQRIELTGPDSAQKFIGGMLDAIDRLADFPQLGPEHPDALLARLGYRKLVYDKYIIVYRIVDTTVAIARIVHGSSNYPELWR